MLSISGGVTTALVLPGSANSIGKRLPLIVSSSFTDLSVFRWSSIPNQVAAHNREDSDVHASRNTLRISEWDRLEADETRMWSVS
jgi:hypothetical protein